MPTTETAVITRAPAMPEYIVSLTLRNGVQGYYTGAAFTSDTGHFDPQMVLAVAAHEGAVAEVLDQAFRGPLLAVARAAQGLRDYGPPGMAVEIVEYVKAGGAA